MICHECRIAGRLLQELGAEGNQKRLTRQHEKCPGGTWCDCAHKLSGVNWEQINMEKRNDAE